MKSLDEISFAAAKDLIVVSLRRQGDGGSGEALVKSNICFAKPLSCVYVCVFVGNSKTLSRPRTLNPFKRKTLFSDIHSPGETQTDCVQSISLHIQTDKQTD